MKTIYEIESVDDLFSLNANVIEEGTDPVLWPSDTRIVIDAEFTHVHLKNADGFKLANTLTSRAIIKNLLKSTGLPIDVEE